MPWGENAFIPNGAKGVPVSVDLCASGGESPFTWNVESASAGLQASLIGSTLSVTANAPGAYEVRSAVVESVGGWKV
jgi:hypothetical protein